MTRFSQTVEFVRRMQLNPYHLTVLMALLLALMGVPLAYLFDPDGNFFSALRGVSQNTVWRSYILTVWAFLVILPCLNLTINRRIKIYQAERIATLPGKIYTLLWLGSVLLGLVCMAYLYWQNKFCHPFFSSIHLDALSYSLKRAQINQNINMHVYNVGAKFFVPFALLISIFFIRRFWLTIVTIAIFILIATFSLERSNIPSAILLLIFVYLLMGKPSVKTVFTLLLLFWVCLLMMFFVSKSANTFFDFLVHVYRRIFYGQFTDLPYYFHLFRDNPLEFKAILPPYVQSMTGEVLPSAARVVMQYVNPQGVARGVSGTSNSIFVGEAYAFGGMAGVILAPFWIVIHFTIVVRVITSQKKNLIRVFILGYLFYLLTIGLFNAFGYFLFSSAQIIFVSYLLIDRLLTSALISRALPQDVEAARCVAEAITLQKSVIPFRNSKQRLRSMLFCVPRYFFEVREVRNLKELYLFFLYKLPYLFPLQAFPPKITLEITNRCNFLCQHCHRNIANEGRQLGFMELGLFEKIIAEIGSHCGPVLKIGGWGEPSLHPRIREMLSLCYEQKVRTYIYTNGSLFDFFTPREILQWEWVTIVVSIDGLDSYSFSQLRKGGDLNTIRNSVQEISQGRRTFRADHPKIVINHVIFPAETNRELAAFWKKWIVMADVVDFSARVPLYPVYQEPLPHPAALKPCLRCRRELSILYDGSIPLCAHAFRLGTRELLGDIHDFTIQELWNHSRLRELRRQHKENALNIPGFCKSCLLSG